MGLAYKNKILEFLKESEESLLVINETQDMELFCDSFNKFIEYFVSIDEIRKAYNDERIEEILGESSEQLSDLLVKSVELINQDNRSDFLLLLPEINNAYEKWASMLRENLKYKIIVFGINEICTIIDKIIDLDKADIVFYISDNGENVGSYLNGKIIYGIESISSALFDYVFSVCNNNEIVDKIKQSGIIKDEQLIDYNFFKNLIISSPEFFCKHLDFLAEEKNFTGILTGLSYVQKGVDTSILSGNFLNLAYPGQDLFYDFEMFKYAYNYKEVKENLKYAIIGLGYYSFHYDLSLSANEARVNYYYPITKKMHNNKLAGTYLTYQNQLEYIQEKILKKEHLNEAFNLVRNYYDKVIDSSSMKEYNCQSRTNEELLADIEFIKRDYKKDYPKTVIENKRILEDYLSFLEANSIKPIVIVCPTTKIYQAFTPKKLQQEFYEIINEISLKYEFQFFDYYYSNEFEDSDFIDVSHLNYKGAKKFTRMLNNDIGIN
ncbi:hypothetical protein [Clostridium cellulovorans]|uniref:Uncharacterized protein n=1 Tax=Clostridium cellulovorans (strain ATCC 35296 / DSM 3052 / OCM 3 / 743B) TaxID=573061 RepID=D9SNG1_CLOC7|nr:hypothetical protein [Clostridium cellulovorans]ADL53953.1 hypothetical protein Clocel_4296 [Clostridium cellulovorans 743B]